jgi:hypothetical protein
MLFLPLIHAARAYSGGFWAQPSWSNIPGFFTFMLWSAAVPLAAILVLAGLYFAVFQESGAGTVTARRCGLLSHEVAASLGFLAIPFVAVAMAMFVTGAFTPRYALPAAFGLVVLVAFGLHRVLHGREALTLCLVLGLAVGFTRRGRMTLSECADYVRAREGVIKMLQKEPMADMPVVCSDSHLFIILSHYAPPEVRSRLVYLADPDKSLRYLRHSSLERGTLDLLKPWFRLNVQPYRPDPGSRGQFLLVGDPQNFMNWILQDLVASGTRMELTGRHQEVLLFRVGQRGVTGE